MPAAGTPNGFRYWEPGTRGRKAAPRPGRDDEQFISFEPWNGGFNNIRQVGPPSPNLSACEGEQRAREGHKSTTKPAPNIAPNEVVTVPFRLLVMSVA